MKYRIDYQYLPKDSVRPHDDGEVIGIDATDETGTVILPNVGDFVDIDNCANSSEHSSFYGRVRSRMFHYTRTDTDVYCIVNIVVEETDDDWGKLIKE